jgi:hypothetical protein
MLSSLLASYVRATQKTPVKRSSKKLPCLKSKWLIFPRMEHLEDRTVPSVTLGVAANAVPGTSSFCGCLPPDGAIAVSNTTVIEGVNTAIETFNKSGTVTGGPSSLPTFFSGHGWTVNSLSDPVIVFDENVSRFIIVILDFTSANATDFLDFAISSNDSPTTASSTWTNFRHINVGQTSFFADQPRVGFNADAYFVQFNMFSTGSGAFDHSQVFTIQKSTFTTGGLTTFSHNLPGGNSIASIDPAIMHGAVAGGPEYLTGEGVNLGQSEIIKETNVLSNTPTDVVTTFNVNTYVEPPAAPQPSGTLTTNDSRSMNAAWRDNILVSDQTVGDGTPNTAHARWYQYDTSTTTPTLTMQGDITNGSASTYFPSVDINQFDEIGMTYMESSSSEFESMYVTGKDFNDTSFVTGVKARAGTSNYTGTRMGDYSATQVDPTDGFTYWSENEFETASAAGSWNTGIASYVVKRNTMTTVTSSVNPSVFGQSVTFTATVTPRHGTGTPTGTVTFLDGASTLGSAALASGSATITTSTLTVGNHTITVSYSGDANFNPSTSTALTQTVNKGATSTTVTSSVNPTVFGQATVFTATVAATSPAAGTPGGTVTFLDGGVSFASATLSGGTASVSKSNLSVGNHMITVSYGGDANFNTSASAAITQTVNKGNSSTSVSSSPNASVFGQSVTFTATVSAVGPAAGTPGGTVTFNDGGNSIGSGTLSGGTASFSTSGLSVGNHTITVSYSGDGNFNASTSTAITQTVNKGNSSTSVSSSQNPSVFGQTVTFTATVSAVGPAAGTPGGTVTFNDGGNSIGSGTLSGGTASFSTSGLSVGNHTITVSYSGDGNFNASTSTAITQTVNKGASSTTVASSPNASVFGQTVTFTATVSAVGPAAGTPGGTVTFNDGGNSIGSGTLSGGTASLSTSGLSVGNHTITVSYSGDGNFNASASAAITQTVNKGNSSSSVSSSQNPSVFGQSVTFTATVSAVNPAAGTPGGTVTFNDGGSSIGSATLSGGTGSFSTSSLSVGSHTITVSYSGDSNFTGSTSSAITQTVNQASTSTSVSSGTNPSVFGQSVTFTAQVSVSSPGAGTPAGTVTFSDGGSSIGSGSVSPSGIATFATSGLAVGSHTITASYGGDANFTGSSSSAITQTVNQASSSSSLASSENPSTFGDPTFTVTVSAVPPGNGTPTGTVAFTIDGSPAGSATLSGGSASISTSGLSAGTHTVVATYSGDANFTTSSASLTQTVNQASSSTAVTSSLNPSTFGQSVTFTATVSSTAGTPTGTIQFVLDGSNFGSPITLSGGTATTSTSALSAGVHTVSATYSGDTNFTGSSGTLAGGQTVTAASTTTAIASSANPSLYGNSVTFTATVTSSAGTVNTGTVTFLDGAATLGMTAVSGGKATFATGALTAGVHTITASYSDGTTFGSSSASLNQTVNQRPLFITANSTSKSEGNTLTFAGTEFTLSGPAGSRRPVLFNGDMVNSATITSAGAAANAEDGSYPINISNAVGTGLSNYAITYVPGTLTVLEPAISVTNTPLSAINEGDPSAAVEVATFTHANGVEAPGHFSATIDWGVAGHHADAGTITQDGNGTYHVSGAEPVFSEDGTFNVSVQVCDNDSGANISQNFQGLSANDDIAVFGGFFVPPDQGSAVGPNHYVEMINLVYSIYNKDGSVAVPATALSTFYANAGLPNKGTSLSDPRIVYDPQSGRWFAAIITTDSNSNSIFIAVSQTSDPTGAWKGVSFVANTIANNFADYPTIGVDANAFYIASNNFLNLSTFDGVSLTTIPKADLLASTPTAANRSHFENIVGGGTPGTTPFTFAPVSAFDGRGHGVVMSIDGFTPASVLHHYQVMNPGSNSSSLSADNPIAVPQYWNSQAVHEPDGSRTLDGGGSRTGSNNVYQVGNIVWITDNILPTAATGNGAYDAIRWYEIDESTNTLLQSGTISDPHHDYSYPSIAANAAGDVVIGFTATGDSTTSDYPGAWYVAGTTTGGVTTFGAPTPLRNGISNYNITASGRNRWGDFSAISVDPNNPNSFWIAEEAAVAGDPARTTRTQVWGTQISQITFGNCASASSSLTVNEPAINGSTATLAPVNEGDASASVEVATFTHANGVEPATDFTATVDWGIDGHHADAATVTQDGTGTYHVSALRPVFAEQGLYTVNVSISEDNGSIVVTDTQEVDEPAINGSSATLAPVNEGDAGATVEVATFTHANGVEPATDFAATVDWGIDGHHADAATITQDGSGTYHVSSLQPVFTEDGTYTVTVSISEDNVSTTVTDSQVVNEPPINGSTATLSDVVVGQAPDTVEVATFTHANGVEAPGHFVASVDWGIAGHHADAGTVTEDGGGTYHVSAQRPTFDLPGAYSVAVSIVDDNGSTTVTDTQNVNKADTTITIMSSENPSTFGDSVTFTFTVTPVAPGGITPASDSQVAVMVWIGTNGNWAHITVGASLNAGHTAYVGTLTTDTLMAGDNAVMAMFNGNAQFNPSSATLHQTVNQAVTTTTLTSSPNPSNTGDPVTFTATVSSSAGTPTGMVTFIVDGSSTDTEPVGPGGTATFTTSTLSAGTHTVTATYSGDNNFFASSSSAITQTVNSGVVGTTTTLSSSANPSVFGQSVTFTATVTPTSGSGTPTGTVTFSDGASSIGSGTLSGGQATFTTSSLSVGLHSITATYGGSAGFTGSTSNTVTQTVKQDGTTTTITSSPNPSSTGQSVTFTVTVSPNAPGSGTPTGTVTVTLPKSTIGTFTLSNGQATFSVSTLPAGSSTITASYSGDGNFTTSSGKVTQTVGAKSASTTTLTQSSGSTVFGSPVTFTATVTGSGNTPTGNVTFLDSKVTLAVVALNGSGVATFTTSSLSLGTHKINAQYGGSSTYNTSGSNVVTHTVTSSTSTTLLTSQSAPTQQDAPINPAPFRMVITTPAAQASGRENSLDTAAASSNQTSSAVDRLAMSGLFASPLTSKAGTGALDVAALDRIFSEF